MRTLTSAFGVSAATRERFNFELGSTFTYQQADAPGAHTPAAQRSAFPNGRYPREVQGGMEKAKCDAH